MNPSGAADVEPRSNQENLDTAPAPEGQPADHQAAPSAGPPLDVPVTIITAGRRPIFGELAEIWRYRELLWALAGRDIRVQYKQTVFGVAWAVLQPLLAMVIFSLIFGRFAGLSQHTGAVPYSVFVLAGLLPWQFVSRSINAAGNSLVQHQNMITKVYFPRLIIPLSSLGVGLVDLGVSLVVLLGWMLWKGIVPAATVVFLPLVLLWTITVVLAAGILLAALTARYRDFRYVIPFALQIWMFVSPVIYPPAIVPAQWRWLLLFNPLSGVIDGYRWCLLGTPLEWASLASSLILSTAWLAVAVWYFRLQEQYLADYV